VLGQVFPRVALVIIISILAISCKLELSSFDKGVNELIDKQCHSNSPCKIKIGEATSFDWDEMYVFRPGIIDVEVQHIVPGVTFAGEFNRKIAFEKNGKLVRTDEAASVIEGENTPPGMLFFDENLAGNPDCLRYSRDAEFEVKVQKWHRGDVYFLNCSNCLKSPVFAEFGAAN
jgi:hypothetical protein